MISGYCERQEQEVSLAEELWSMVQSSASIPIAGRLMDELVKQLKMVRSRTLVRGIPSVMSWGWDN